MPKRSTTLAMLIIAALLGACTSQVPDATQTEVALNLTEAMHLTLTPIILATITPSETVAPTNTPTYTKTPQPQIAAQFTFVYEQTRVASTLAPTWTAAAQIASATAYQSTTDAIYRSLIASATAAMWTHTPTSTLVPSLTQIPIPTSTLPVIATFTETDLPTLTPTETIDPIQAAETLFWGGLTQTATLWTATSTETFTPSPNFTETVGARLTEIALEFSTKTATPTTTETPSNTPTNTPTSTPSATSTSTQIATIRLPPTMSSTEISTSNSSQAFVIVSVSSANLRSGPGVNYSILGSAARGERFKIVARSNDSSWYLVNNVGRSMWISASVVEASKPNSEIQIAATIPSAPANIAVNADKALASGSRPKDLNDYQYNCIANSFTTILRLNTPTGFPSPNNMSTVSGGTYVEVLRMLQLGGPAYYGNNSIVTVEVQLLCGSPAFPVVLANTTVVRECKKSECVWK